MKKTLIVAALFALSTSAAGAPDKASKRPRANPEYWWLCPVDRSLPRRPEFSLPPGDAGSTEIRAGHSRMVENDISDFDDNVEVVQDQRALRADHLSYDQPSGIARAFGDVHLWGPGFLWSGQRANVDMQQGKYRAERGLYWLLENPGRGAAEQVRSEDAERTTYLTDVSYTTCPTGAEAWKFSASRLRLDQAADRGYATNALLKVAGVPVFYFPYVSFPLSGKRKSGLLFPTIGTSNVNGIDLRQPYYVDIAPNQDATLIPRWIENRGFMMGAQYRHMTEQSQSEINVNLLPNDRKESDRDRFSIFAKHQQYFDDRRGQVNLLAQDVSDTRYLEDFGGSLGTTSQRFLDRRLETNWSYPSLLAVRGIVQSYQNVDDTLPDRVGPYQRLPQILAKSTFPERHLQPHVDFLADAGYFLREGYVSGGRLGLEPTLSLPFIRPWLTVRPAVGLRNVNYFLSNADTYDSNLSRTLPVASMDMQLFAERRFELGEMAIQQTLEPRAYYLKIPKTGQDQYPLFDSRLYDFSMASIFRENRFSGRDRLGDADQLALALTSRFLSLQSGREVFRASVGQIYYFADREVVLRNRPEQDQSASELISEVATNPTESWSARATVQWDPNRNETEKSAFTIRYAPSDGTLLNASYRLRGGVNSQLFTSLKDDVEQTDLSFRLPMTENISLIGRWNYSLRSQESLELVGGIELETCCWGIRIFSRRYIRNIQGEFDNAFFMQAEFKGLAGTGRSAVSFLRKSLPGYEPTF